jgi:hypothetical protein
MGGEVVSKFGLLGVIGGFLFAYSIELFRILDNESSDDGFCDSLADQDQNKCFAYSFQGVVCFIGAVVQIYGMFMVLCREKDKAGAQCLKCGMFGFACLQISLSSRQYLLASLEGNACDDSSDAAAGGDCASFAISGTMWLGGSLASCLCSLATACSAKNAHFINGFGMLAVAGFYGGFMSEVWNLVDSKNGGGMVVTSFAPCDSNDESACAAVVFQALFWTAAFLIALFGVFNTCKECTHTKALTIFSFSLGFMLFACATERWYEVSSDTSVCNAPADYGTNSTVTDKMCFSIVVEAVFYTIGACLSFTVYGAYVASVTI